MHNNTLWRIMVFATIISIICSLTLTNWGSIAAIVAALIVVGGLIYKVVGRALRKHQLRGLFDVYYEPKEDEPQTTWSGKLGEHQQVQIMLRMKADVNVSFIRISFEGDINKPEINSLYEWEYGIGRIEHPDVRTSKTMKGWWYWNYSKPLPKAKFHRIKIGIEYTAASSFKGNLNVALTCIEANKDLSLPFEVTDLE